MSSKYGFTVLLAALLLGISVSEAQGASVGRWHVPGTCAQWWGCGFGAGHHAPMIRYHHFQTPPAPRNVRAPSECQPHGHCCHGGGSPLGYMPYASARPAPQPQVAAPLQPTGPIQARYLPAGSYAR